MGNFKVEVEAIGGHGCQRSVRDGEKVEMCKDPACPDCITRRYIEELRTKAGCSMLYAVLAHWPHTDTEVTDNLLTKRRRGNF